VDPVALHIHERVSAQAILKVAARQDVTRSLFADPEQEYRDAVDFYKHDVAWTNRLILGDSLEVMASLAKREDLAGKVQAIYMDPPYGIKYGSNFQSEVGKRDVKDKPEDLTREPEMVKAYRDTWNLGVHSYLAYLRDRLYAAKDLLSDSGSIFLQISDENLHRVRMIMDEVFGPNNFVSQISIQKTGSTVGSFIQTNVDFLLWYAKDKLQAEPRFRPILLYRRTGGAGGSGYSRVEELNGSRRPFTALDFGDDGELNNTLKLWRSYPLTSDGFRETTTVDFHFQGGILPPKQSRPRIRRSDTFRQEEQDVAKGTAQRAAERAGNTKFTRARRQTLDH
jgi:adenine-specific DNA-methyltransferase